MRTHKASHTIGMRIASQTQSGTYTEVCAWEGERISALARFISFPVRSGAIIAHKIAVSERFLSKIAHFLSKIAHYSSIPGMRATASCFFLSRILA